MYPISEGSVAELSPDDAPEWFFNRCIDLEKWLPAISTHPGEGQESDGIVIAAFDASFPPSERHGLMFAASQQMYLLLKAGLPLLRRAAVENEDRELRAQCDKVAEAIALIDSSTSGYEK